MLCKKIKINLPIVVASLLKEEKTLNKINLKGTAIDSVFLTLARFITALSGIVVAKLLSTEFTLQEYGTYSQANLIIGTVTSLTIMGLCDATNYFYNAASDDEEKNRSIATIFGIQYIIGVFAAVIIMIFQIPIIHYFKNDELKKIIMFVAWMPVFENILPMLQVLFVSIGEARLIAVRNFFLSCARLIIVAVSCFITKEVYTIFFALLMLDIFQVVIFKKLLSNHGYGIDLKRFSVSLVPTILRFCIPMAIFVFVNSLNRDIDKYVIALLTNTETLGIYSNAARLLPFDMFTASFITVLVPIITRQVKANKDHDAFNSLRLFVRVCYYTTWILVIGAIVNAKELMLFLYDEKYLVGLPIFIVYLLVDLISLMGTTLVIVAKGKNNLLVPLSSLMLVLNFIFNIVSFKFLGLVGPAITTLFVTIVYTIIILVLSTKMLNSSFWNLFEWKDFFAFLIELCILSIVTMLLKKVFYQNNISYIVNFVVMYSFFVLSMLLINRNKLLKLFKQMNKLR